MQLRVQMCAILLALAAGSSQNLFATNATVGLCAGPGTHYLNIQSAVNAVQGTSGATVDVCPGTYAEQVSVTKGLVLQGTKGPGTLAAAIIVPPAAGITPNGSDIFGNAVAAQIFVASTSGNVTVKGLIVDGTGNDPSLGCLSATLEGIYFQNTSGTITDNTVRNQYDTNFAGCGGDQYGLAINVESVGSNAVTVSNNSVRSYQKNGITATGNAPNSGGPNATISTNYIVGLGATALDWPLSGAAENGIQVGFGATGKITNNVVNDNIWAQDITNNTPQANAASGILIYASPNITITGNEVGSAQYGIALETDNGQYNLCTSGGATISCGTADNSIVESNKVAGTQVFDAIDACSNSNTVHGNTLYGSTESAVHIDDTCTNSDVATISGNDNAVTNNGINEACAGILLGTGTGNTITPNTFYNVTNTTFGGDTCPLGWPESAAMSGNTGALASSTEHSKARPSPYARGRK